MVVAYEMNIDGMSFLESDIEVAFVFVDLNRILFALIYICLDFLLF